MKKPREFWMDKDSLDNEKPWEAMCKKALEERRYFEELLDEQTKAVAQLVEALEKIGSALPQNALSMVARKALESYRKACE